MGAFIGRNAVKDVASDYDEIRPEPVGLIHDFPDIFFADDGADMKIAELDDPVLFPRLPLRSANIIADRLQLQRMNSAVYRDNHAEKAGRQGENFMRNLHPKELTEHDPDQICGDQDDQMIQQKSDIEPRKSGRGRIEDKGTADIAGIILEPQGRKRACQHDFV